MRIKTAYNFVLKAAAKTIPDTINNLKAPLRIAIKSTNKLNRLKNKHGTSIKRLLERTRCHGLNARSVVAIKPVVLLYANLPIA